MAKLVVASALTRWLAPAAEARGELSLQLSGDSVEQCLQQLFSAHPSLRSYVVDERGAVRHHVALFIDGVALQPKSNLGLAVDKDSEIYIMQALSGG